jgi:murein DD-endopeptidase MepM/ murein hydrolase activator NlpD
MTTTLQQFYSNIGVRFGVHGPFYGPQGHRGQDFPHADGTPTPAWEAGTVENIQHSTVIGTVVVLRLHDGKFSGYAHLKANPPVRIGQAIALGQIIGFTAGYEDQHGTAWSGPHLHTTLGATGAAVFAGIVYDPLPRIEYNIRPVVPVQRYAVKAGDTLSSIAQHFYGTPNWQKLFMSNRYVIGSNPNVIRVGLVLVIPK